MMFGMDRWACSHVNDESSTGLPAKIAIRAAGEQVLILRHIADGRDLPRDAPARTPARERQGGISRA